MSKEHYVSNNFYTFEEIRDFTNNFTDLNLINITKFIELKTMGKYTVVPSEFVKDVNKQFLDNKMLIFKFAGLTNDLWEELKADNEKVIKKHEETLNKFDAKDK